MYDVEIKKKKKKKNYIHRRIVQLVNNVTNYHNLL